MEASFSSASSLRIPAGLKMASLKSRFQILVCHSSRLNFVVGLTASYDTAVFREFG